MAGIWIEHGGRRIPLIAGGQVDESAMANQRALIQYYQEKLRELDIPQFQAMTQQQKDELAAQMAQHAAELYFREQELGTQTRTREREISAQTALSGADQAGREQIQREQIGLQGLQQADESAIAREGLGLQGLRSAEDVALANRELALRGAEMQSNEALRALELAGQYSGGASNPFVAQAVMHGLNAQGVTRGMDALAGRYALPSFQAPQYAPEARSLATIARDAQMYGGAPPAYLTGGDLALASATQSAADPYGVGGSGMLEYGISTVQNPVSTYADYAAQYGVENAETDFGSPSQSIALGLAGANAPEGMPVAPSDLIQGQGQPIIDAYLRMAQEGHADPEREQRAIRMLQEGLGMSPQEAAELNQYNKDNYLAGLGPVTAARMETLAQQIKQRRAIGTVNAPVGEVQRATDAYYDVLRQDKEPYLSVGDPRLTAIHQQSFRLPDAQANAMAQGSADYYKANRTPVGGGAMEAMLSRVRKMPQPPTDGQGVDVMDQRRSSSMPAFKLPKVA